MVANSSKKYTKLLLYWTVQLRTNLRVVLPYNFFVMVFVKIDFSISSLGYMKFTPLHFLCVKPVQTKHVPKTLVNNGTLKGHLICVHSHLKSSRCLHGLP